MIARKLMIGLLFILVAIPGLSQNKEFDKEAKQAGVSIVKTSWRSADYDSGLFSTDTGSFEIHVKNIGPKTITAVNWEYFLLDTVRDRIYDHLKFRTDDKKIKPGETKKLVKSFEYRYDAPDYIRGKVKIMRVEYEDGSVWVRSSEN